MVPISHPSNAVSSTTRVRGVEPGAADQIFEGLISNRSGASRKVGFLALSGETPAPPAVPPTPPLKLLEVPKTAPFGPLFPFVPSLPVMEPMIVIEDDASFASRDGR
jgi:hypothetical protein